MAKIKSLDLLISMRKEELDKLRQRKTLLEDQLAMFERELGRLKKERQAESEKMAGDPSMMEYWTSYAAENIKRQGLIGQAVERIEGQLDDLTNHMAGAFAELKKVEIAKEKQLAEEKAARELAEAQQLDEIGSQRHFRQSKGES